MITPHAANAPLKPSAQRVQDALSSLGYCNQVVEFADSTRTAAEAAAAVGCTVGQIAKSLLFRGENSGRAILVITSGSNRVHEQRAAQQIGERLDKADADFVREATGFAIGGVPPLGHHQPVATYIDGDLLQYTSIWAAAGHPHAVFCLRNCLKSKGCREEVGIHWSCEQPNLRN
jgi:prolyl-tRNA editing enzyme YbaK/EbsC (Cys-tRNA(Pro) deacylase)